MSLLIGDEKCTSCQVPLHLDSGDLICTKCGTVYEQKIPDLGVDYDVGEDGKGARTGPVFDPRLGMPQTIIGVPGSKDKLNSLQKLNAIKITKADKRMKTDEVLIGANMEIQKLVKNLGLGDNVADFAKQIFNSCRKKKMLRGRKTLIIAMGCVYTACKIQNIPRTSDDFCRQMNVSKSKLIKTHHLISKNVDFEQKFAEPEAYISRISDILKISRKTETVAKTILDKYPNRQGKNPVILMAAAIYIASEEKEKISQAQLAMAARCSEVAIGHRVRDMKKHVPQ